MGMVKKNTVIKMPERIRTPANFKSVNSGSATIEYADAIDCYSGWEPPTAIIADGPYGLSKFPGDPSTPDALAKWYAPHVAEWSRHALPETTLWFWCTEIGWAEVHPVLKFHGWKYKATHVWDKGIGHVAGNCNGDTIRGFPVVTEICVQYTREAQLENEDGDSLALKEWLRFEWQRSGLPLCQTNQACGVKNAATRKYFTQDHMWYFPPAEKMVALAKYATEHGKLTDRPYFSLDGKTPLTIIQWARMRAKWCHTHGLTNVWSEPAVRGLERIKGKGLKCLHMNQKPLKLIERLLLATTEPGDTVWEPFGGLCSVAASSLKSARHCYGAEVISEYFLAAQIRLQEEIQSSVEQQNKQYANSS